MNPQRRTLLKAAGIAPAATSAALAHAAFAPQTQHGTPAQTTLLRNHFAPLQGDAFEFRKACGARAIATLQLASPLPGAVDGEASFRLVFTPAAHQSLTQDTWEVFHTQLGTHAIFVSPNDAAGRVVEAIFNREHPL